MCSTATLEIQAALKPDVEIAERKTSLTIYSALVLWTAAVAVMSPANPSAALRTIGWPQVTLAAGGFLGVLLLRKANLPALWNKAGAWRILGMPFLIGLVFGCISVLCMQWLMPVDPVAPMPPFLQPFPWSVALFSAGAVVMEAMFCLIPIPLITSALLRIAPSSRANWPFLTAAGLAVCAETFVVFQEIPEQVRILVPCLATLSVIQVILFRRFGYLAALSTRLGHYAVWHIGFGLWFQGMAHPASIS